MLKRYMHNRERHFAMLNDNRIVRPFEWGDEFVTERRTGETAAEALSRYSKDVLADTDSYFSLETEPEFSLEDRLYPAIASINPPGNELPIEQTEIPVLTWQSGVITPSLENNTAVATYFPYQSKRAAVIVLPHWNAKAGTYFDLCRFFNKIGFSALRLTLPYHEERMPPELERADHLVSPNIGRSLQSIRQAVLDTRAAVSWLKRQGYERVGIVGTSIGSCVAFLAFVHDARINAAVFNHVSGYMADVVWHGLSTYHVRSGLEQGITLDDLREFWLPVSPMAYLKKLAAQPSRPQRYIYTIYDLSFPINLSRDVMNALRSYKIKHSKAAIPCGHYTLGEKPWVYLDGYKIIRFLHKHLK
ncbi:RcgR family putative quorum lactone hydrolase [Leptolyngbya sp. 7M]|uniref:alpha/beta hydrolase family protein n=1 Tax=Leptolyngbya sp. 7M TaxID=2812896 RepID=UPI001B8AD500|nr:dienelactone hydrolase family protein [Leptolyngbya sp. 7M]QYO65307.1 dienelactone hydrolase family protein [Leptolyngbya sp. 7M]